MGFIGDDRRDGSEDVTRLKLEVTKKDQSGWWECWYWTAGCKTRDEKNVLAGKQQVKISIFKMIF